MIKLERILNIYKSDDLDDFIKEISGFNLNERNLTDDIIENKWTFVGNNPSNCSSINILSDPEKGIVERVTNGIDAVLEAEKIKYEIQSAKNSDVIIQKAYPKYYKNKRLVIDKKGSMQPYETNNKVILAINDGSKSNKPTIDVIDNGMGIDGIDFPNTILSINQGNKLSVEKNYLIGAFGHGGSTSLPHSHATIIVSKYKDRFYFTVIKRVELARYKTYAFVYLNDHGVICETTPNDINQINDKYLLNFINSDGGTLVRMIETEISKEYRMNDITKPGLLNDYINTELFNVPLPVKMIENRTNYIENKHSQDRYSYGSYAKLHSWKYAKNEYCGTIEIIHNHNPYKINYYIILPSEEEKWGSDSECKKVYRMFNVHLDPIIYTVNGQYIASELFTKIKNSGLSFLQYRLLVEINLDVLGSEKYKFFTSDRARIQNSDLTRGFVDEIVKVLKNESKLIEINSIIAEKSINTQIDSELIENISNNVKNIYSKFLKSGNIISSTTHGRHYKADNEDIYLDHISELIITSERSIFNKDESVKIILTTKARKSVNQEAIINLFVDEKAQYDIIPTFMNGRIQYIFSENKLSIGKHSLYFSYFPLNKDMIESEKFEFEIIDELSKEKKESANVSLNIEVHLVDERELLVDVVCDDKNKKIDVYLCLTHDLMNEVYGKSGNTDAIQSLKQQLIQPLVLFVLFMKDQYENMPSVEDKNKLVLSFSKTIAITLN